MSELRALAGSVLFAAGLSAAEVELALQRGWSVPDPAALAVPLADLPALFAGLRARGLHVAVATTDDRAATLASLRALGVADLVATLICGDDGVPVKPAPDMVWAACRAVGVAPAQAIVVGDSVADLQMARAAGAGLAVAVLSGVTPAASLAPLADVVLPSVAGLLAPA